MADKGSKRIETINYDPKVLELSNSGKGLTSAIYESIPGLDSITSLSVDYLGKLFWSVSHNGESKGAVKEAQADDPNAAEIKTVTKIVDSASSLCYSKEILYFSGGEAAEQDGGNDDDESGEETKNSAIYYKNMPKTGEIGMETKLISDKFRNVVSISVVDKYIYIADQSHGMYAIEAFENDEFSEPRRINLTFTANSEEKQTSPKPQAMLVFTLDAVFGASVSLAATFVLAALSFLWKNGNDWKKRSFGIENMKRND